MLMEADRGRLEQIIGKGDVKELSLRQAQRIATEMKMPLRVVEAFALEKACVPRRYQRNLGSLGTAGQKRLLESRVIVVGLGGVGGYVLEELARAGVGQIVGVDPDVLDETNLNRQLLADQDNLGKKKVDEAKKRLERVNESVEFAGYAASLDELSDEILRGADLVFDCLDNVENRLKLADRCSDAGVVLVHGAIAGWYGQVAVVCPGDGTLEKAYRRKQSSGIEQNLGNPPFTAALAASLMVAEGVKVLTGKSSNKKAKLLFFDLLEDEWQTIAF